MSLTSGIFPNNMKIAKVIPLYKSNGKNEFTNYRPVSLLPQFSNILENLFGIRLDSFINIYNLLRHRSDILESNVGSYAGNIGDAFISMQDNARAHTYQVYTTFLGDKGISAMNWLVIFPDLTPLEHTWNIISRCIRQWPHYPENVQTLIEALVQRLQMILQKGNMSSHIDARSVWTIGEGIQVIGEQMC